MIQKVHTFKLHGIEAVPVVCECEITKGGGFHIVGLADTASKEALLRTVTAMQSCGFNIPGRRIILNFAPSDLVKTGTGYDLPMALAMLRASEQAELPDLDKWVVVGELGLDGLVRDVPGLKQACDMALKGETRRNILIPGANLKAVAELGELYGEAPIFPVITLYDAIRVISNPEDKPKAYDYIKDEENTEVDQDWSALASNPTAMRAAEIAAAGGHNMFIIGPVGSAKTALARALVKFLPPMTFKEIHETAEIYSATGHTGSRDLLQRPFRCVAPYSSVVAMLGGGTQDTVRPGEVTLAHNGVFCMPDAAEAPKCLLEALRGPIEDKNITIHRLHDKYVFPAKALYVFTSNPCPCGHYGDGDKCVCTPNQRKAFLSRLTGPLYDLLDVQVWMHPARPLKDGESASEIEDIQALAWRIVKARKIQEKRFENEPFSLNAEMDSKALAKYVTLTDVCKELIEDIIVKMGLSARAYNRILRIARTIADLDRSDEIKPQHIAEAASFRFLDRTNND